MTNRMIRQVKKRYSRKRHLLRRLRRVVCVKQVGQYLHVGLVNESDE
jgi:hypothetical protein